MRQDHSTQKNHHACVCQNTFQKMTHPSLGRIQKYLLRKAFDYKSDITGNQLLPDSVLYREKEQFADGVGRSWIGKLQEYASAIFPDLSPEDAESELYRSYLTRLPGQRELIELIQIRQARRKHYSRRNGRAGKPGRPQPMRWLPVRHDPDLAQLGLSTRDATHFLERVLGWSPDDADSFSPNLQNLNKVRLAHPDCKYFHGRVLIELVWLKLLILLCVLVSFKNRS